jgi:hypothetical protein
MSTIAGVVAWAAMAITTIAPAVPGTVGQTAAGASIQLSEAARGHPSILLVGFSKKAGEETGRWEAKLWGDRFPQESNVEIYRVAMLQSVPTWLRMLARRNIRHGSRPARPEHLVLLFQDEQVWKTFVHFGDRDDVYVVLVDRSGAAVWSGHGNAESATYGLLRDQVRQMPRQAR